MSPRTGLGAKPAAESPPIAALESADDLADQILDASHNNPMQRIGRCLLILVLPTTLLAATLYQQPNDAIASLGRYSHLISAICVFASSLILIRLLSLKILIGVAVPTAYLVSLGSDDRTAYIIVLMTLFFLCGVALACFCRKFAFALLIAVSIMSVGVMALQLYGWPSWINALATHGNTQNNLSLHPTLFIDFSGLQALYWQTRPAGLFSSNQMNTLFCFMFLAVFFSVDRTSMLKLLPVAALYVVLTLSKGAIFGSVLLAISMALIYGREYPYRAALYLPALMAAFGLYYFLFPGVVATFFSPYVLYVSVLSRLLDLLNSMGGAAVVEQIRSYAGHTGSIENALRETSRALDAGEVAGVTLYAEIARNPALSVIIFMASAIVAFALKRREQNWWCLSPFHFASLSGLFFYTIVAPVGSHQAFWLFLGMAFAPIYIGLFKTPHDRHSTKRAVVGPVLKGQAAF